MNLLYRHTRLFSNGIQLNVRLNLKNFKSSLVLQVSNISVYYDKNVMIQKESLKIFSGSPEPLRMSRHIS